MSYNNTWGHTNWGPTSYPIPPFGQFSQGTAVGQTPAAQQYAQQQQASGINWCQGIEGAKGFYVEPGRSAFIMDSEQPCFYIKAVDPSGIPAPLRVFDYSERAAAPQPQPTQQATEYVTRAEFDRLAAQIAAMTQAEGGNANG